MNKIDMIGLIFLIFLSYNQEIIGHLEGSFFLFFFFLPSFYFRLLHMDRCRSLLIIKVNLLQDKHTEGS